MNPAKLSELITVKEAEKQSMLNEVATRKAEVERQVAEFQQWGSQVQLRVTHIEGRIAQLREIETFTSPDTAAPSTSEPGTP